MGVLIVQRNILQSNIPVHMTIRANQVLLLTAADCVENISNFSSKHACFAVLGSPVWTCSQLQHSSSWTGAGKMPERGAAGTIVETDLSKGLLFMATTHNADWAGDLAGVGAANATRTNANPGIFKRFLGVLMEPRQRAAEREIGAYVARHGGVLTDDLERSISRNFGQSSGSFR